jgi:hypothetical protein
MYEISETLEHMHVMQHADILLQHHDETLKTTEMLENICLQHAYSVIATYATFRSTFATFR